MDAARPCVFMLERVTDNHLRMRRRWARRVARELLPLSELERLARLHYDAGVLSSRVCLRPLGYDPMLNLLSLDDLAHALSLAAISRAAGVFNIPGRDTLPLSELIRAAHRVGAPVPGPLLAPLYALRTRLTRRRFDYSSDQALFHYGAVVDGSKARRLLGYEPTSPIAFDALFAREDAKAR